MEKKRVFAHFHPNQSWDTFSNNTLFGEHNLCYSKTHYPQINKKCYFKNVIQKTRKVPFPKNVIHKITHLPKTDFVLPFKKHFEKIIINKINE